MRALLGLASMSVCFATGCPGGDGGSDPEQLVGTWREIQSTVADPSERETLVVNADGTYSRSDTTGALDSGTYSADRDRVTIHASVGGGVVTVDEGYLIDGDLLAVGTLVPDGEPDGLVGSWHGEIHQGDESVVVDIDLRADGTASYRADSTEDGMIDVSGTWADTGGDVVITIPGSGGNLALHAKYIAGKVITDKLYQRVP